MGFTKLASFLVYKKLNLSKIFYRFLQDNLLVIVNKINILKSSWTHCIQVLSLVAAIATFIPLRCIVVFIVSQFSFPQLSPWPSCFFTITFFLWMS